MSSFVTDTVEEEIAYGMEALGVDATAMRRRVEETLDLLGLADVRSRPLRDLSGGQQQRVAIGGGPRRRPRASWSSTSPPRPSTPWPPRTCSPPCTGWCTTSA